jgi:predicted RNA-binding Zn ribbon-like protein
MPFKPQTSKEWVDGFLFVGNQLALDLLNTRPILSEGPKELLSDPDALVRWLIAANALTSQKGKKLATKWSSTPGAAAFLKEILAFRERLRAAVLRQEAELPILDTFLAEVNSLLKQHRLVYSLHRSGRTLTRTVSFEPKAPADVWAPIVMAVAELLSEVPAVRVRKCESCVVHFHDTSKKGSRRWCSMNICGNKVKVAAYQRRNKAAGDFQR